MTLDVGHAKVNGRDWREFAGWFGDRIRVLYLSDNDGTADDHEPITEYGPIVDAVGADDGVFEMKSVDDIGRCVGPT